MLPSSFPLFSTGLIRSDVRVAARESNPNSHSVRFSAGSDQFSKSASSDETPQQLLNRAISLLATDKDTAVDLMKQVAWNCCYASDIAEIIIAFAYGKAGFPQDVNIAKQFMEIQAERDPNYYGYFVPAGFAEGYGNGEDDKYSVKDAALAEKWFDRYAELSLDNAYQVARIYKKGMGCLNPNPEKAAALYKKVGLETDSYKLKRDVAWLFIDDHVIPQDKALALTLLRQMFELYERDRDAGKFISNADDLEQNRSTYERIIRELEQDLAISTDKP